MPRSQPSKKSGSEEPLLVPPGEVVVRMYRQGLGDCFLLAFGGASDSDRTSYLLIDCGVHARQDQGRARLAHVLDNLHRATGGRLNVVVATHEHADHLSGFVQQGSPFLQRAFTIDQLWLAWTEQLGDELADKLRQRRGTARKIVERAVHSAEVAAFTAPPEQHLALTALSNQLRATADFEQDPVDADNESALNIIRNTQRDRLRSRGLERLLATDDEHSNTLGAARKSQDQPTSNELAIGLLQAQAAEVRFCRPGELLNLKDVKGVRVHVLGPPHDEAKLKKDLPSATRDEKGEDRYKETYLSSAADSLSFGLSPALGGADLADPLTYPDDLRNPFDATQRRKLDFAFPEDEQFDNLPEATRQVLDNGYYDAAADWRRIDADWLAASAGLALNLDSDTNNTSLVLAFEWNNHVLLFVGDAQVGNWLSWQDQEYHGMSIADLLKRTLLYKVGHHGSHNATLKRNPTAASKSFPLGAPYGLELMHDIVALIPVDRRAAEKEMPYSWEMPHQPLYERLREKARRRVLRSDAEPNVRPLPSDSPRDVTPQNVEFEPVPDMPGAYWRKSRETLSGPHDPLYYEIKFTKD